MPRTTRRSRKAAAAAAEERRDDSPDAIPAVGANSNGTISNGMTAPKNQKKTRQKQQQQKQKGPSSPRRTRSGATYAQKSPAEAAGNTIGTAVAGKSKTGTAKKKTTDGGNLPLAAGKKSQTVARSNAKSAKAKSARSKSAKKSDDDNSSGGSSSPSVSPAEVRRVARELEGDLDRRVKEYFSSDSSGSPSSKSGGSPKSRSRSGGGGCAGGAGATGCKKKKKGQGAGGGGPGPKKSGGGTKKKGDGVIPLPELVRMYDAPTDKKDLRSLAKLGREFNAPTDNLMPIGGLEKFVQQADESNGRRVVKEGATNDDDGKVPAPIQPGKSLQHHGGFLKDELGEGGTVDGGEAVDAAAGDGEDAAGAEARAKFGPYAPAWAHFDKFMQEMRKTRAEQRKAWEENTRKFDPDLVEKVASYRASLSSPVAENEGETEGTDETMTAGAAIAAAAGAKEETAKVPAIAKWKGDGSSPSLAAGSDVVAKEHGSSFGGDVAPPASSKSPSRSDGSEVKKKPASSSSLSPAGHIDLHAPDRLSKEVKAQTEGGAAGENLAAGASDGSSGTEGVYASMKPTAPHRVLVAPTESESDEGEKKKRWDPCLWTAPHRPLYAMTESESDNEEEREKKAMMKQREWDREWRDSDSYASPSEDSPNKSGGSSPNSANDGSQKKGVTATAAATAKEQQQQKEEEGKKKAPSITGTDLGKKKNSTAAVFQSLMRPTIRPEMKRDDAAATTDGFLSNNAKVKTKTETKTKVGTIDVRNSAKSDNGGNGNDKLLSSAIMTSVHPLKQQGHPEWTPQQQQTKHKQLMTDSDGSPQLGSMGGRGRTRAKEERDAKMPAGMLMERESYSSDEESGGNLHLGNFGSVTAAVHGTGTGYAKADNGTIVDGMLADAKKNKRAATGTDGAQYSNSIMAAASGTLPEMDLSEIKVLTKNNAAQAAQTAVRVKKTREAVALLAPRNDFGGNPNPIDGLDLPTAAYGTRTGYAKKPVGILKQRVSYSSEEESGGSRPYPGDFVSMSATNNGATEEEVAAGTGKAQYLSGPKDATGGALLGGSSGNGGYASEDEESDDYPISPKFVKGGQTDSERRKSRKVQAKAAGKSAGGGASGYATSNQVARGTTDGGGDHPLVPSATGASARVHFEVDRGTQKKPPATPSAGTGDDDAFGPSLDSPGGRMLDGDPNGAGLPNSIQFPNDGAGFGQNDIDGASFGPRTPVRSPFSRQFMSTGRGGRRSRDHQRSVITSAISSARSGHSNKSELLMHARHQTYETKMEGEEDVRDAEMQCLENLQERNDEESQNIKSHWDTWLKGVTEAEKDKTRVRRDIEKKRVEATRTCARNRDANAIEFHEGIQYDLQYDSPSGGGGGRTLNFDGATDEEEGVASGSKVSE